MSLVAPVLPSPVEDLSGEEGKSPAEGIAISLSGGGYRAMLFHVGALWRLAEFEFFGSSSHAARNADGSIGTAGTLQRISSVSGGSLIAGLLALKWSALQVNRSDVPARYVQHVVTPIRRFAKVTIAGKQGAGVTRLLLDVILPGSVNAHVVAAYKEDLYGDATLQDLPDSPRFVINASNPQSGALWRFSKPYSRVWRVGEIKRLTTSPAAFSFREQDYTLNSGATDRYNLQRPPFTVQPVLADGGVYNNLGLETAFKRYRTLLVSKAADEKVPSDSARIGRRCVLAQSLVA